MALSRTKTAITWQASGANAAGGTTTGTTQDLTGADGAIVEGTFTNGATGPTLGVTQFVEVSSDNFVADTTVFAQETAPTTNSATGNFQPVIIPPEVMYARVRYSGNTGQAVTVGSKGSKVVYS